MLRTFQMPLVIVVFPDLTIFVVICWERADFLAFLCVVILVIFFVIWCPGSGMVLDCIDSRSLPSSLLSISLVT